MGSLTDLILDVKIGEAGAIFRDRGRVAMVFRLPVVLVAPELVMRLSNIGALEKTCSHCGGAVE